MKRGYTLLWRKVWANRVVFEPGHKFSRLEAWLHLVNVLAAGTADEGAGICRGEFCASARFLARAWNWPRTSVQRFLRDLRAAKMIAPVEAGGDAKSAKTRLGHLAGHFAGQVMGHFIVCNYELYNPSRATERAAIRATSRAKLKEVVKEVENNTGLSAGTLVSPITLLKIYHHHKDGESDVPTAARAKRNGERYAIDRRDANEQSGSIEPGGTSIRKTSRGAPAYIPKQ